MSPVPPALSLDVVQRRRKWFAGLVLLALIVLTASVRSVAALDGDRAREALPTAVSASRDRLCTVSRTVQLPTAVNFTLE